jgi:hypothetical protein
MKRLFGPISGRGLGRGRIETLDLGSPVIQRAVFIEWLEPKPQIVFQGVSELSETVAAYRFWQR